MRTTPQPRDVVILYLRPDGAVVVPRGADDPPDSKTPWIAVLASDAREPGTQRRRFLQRWRGAGPRPSRLEEIVCQDAPDLLRPGAPVEIQLGFGARFVGVVQERHEVNGGRDGLDGTVQVLVCADRAAACEVAQSYGWKFGAVTPSPDRRGRRSRPTDPPPPPPSIPADVIAACEDLIDEATQAVRTLDFAACGADARSLEASVSRLVSVLAGLAS